MVTQDQLKDISLRVSKLRAYLEIDKKLIEISNEEELTANPDFWNNPKEAEVIMKSLRFTRIDLWFADNDLNAAYENKAFDGKDDLKKPHVNFTED